MDDLQPRCPVQRLSAAEPMRRIVVALFALALSAARTPWVVAQTVDQPPTDRNPNQCTNVTDGYLCPWGFVQSISGSGGSGGGSGTGSSTPVVYVDRVGIGPDGTPCYYSVAIPAGPLTPGTNLGYFSGPVFAPDYPRCPARPGAAIDPRSIAAQGWVDVPLPKPKPYIAPGWGLTGKLAYLETRGELHSTFTTDTPIGPLQIDSTGSYFVDWGDGEKSGPISAEGGPWPVGQITHLYRNVGTYRVVVTEKWRANWRLGNASGVLTGQQTSGRIDDFRVEQIQVVVTPG